MSKGYVAFDLGAESGRAMVLIMGSGITGRGFELVEAHRFANIPVRLPSGIHWDFTGLWANLVTGLTKAGVLARERGIDLVSLGVDTWGVDCGLIGQSGQLLGLPFAYRDERNAPAMEATHQKRSAESIYEATGIQMMPFNTLYQFVAQKNAEPTTLENATSMLNMPDLLHYFFSGERVNEATIASTTQMVDPHTGQWNRELLESLELPSQLLGDITPAGTRIGSLRTELAELCHVPEMAVIVPGSHDTASAVAAVPSSEDSGRWAFLSSGTWSLLGAELDQPVVSEASYKASFTNERGVGNRIRFLKNISGLWLVQEVRRDLERQGQTYDYAQLTEMASQAEAFQTLIDPAHGPFASPGQMLKKISDFATATGQPSPETPGSYVRCCLESLALCYAQTLSDLEAVLGETFDTLHVVGGGGKNQLLQQMTADAIGRRVIVGPYEATAIGNALTQAIGYGDIQDLDALRGTVREAVEPRVYEPQSPAAFDAQREHFQTLCDQ